MTLPPDVAANKKLSLVLGCPTDTSVVLNVLSEENSDGFCEYGIASANYIRKTETVEFTAGKPVDIVLNQLPPDKQCFYRLRYRKHGGNTFAEGTEHSFHTQRSPGSAFIFEIQGDSHPERAHQFNSELYARTLRGAAADHPDFYITIGDDFSVDTLGTVNADTVYRRYLVQRPFLGLLGHSAPLFLVNGNHEQAAACNLDGTPDNVAVWAQNSRNRLFPQPEPDGFYTGDSQTVKFIGRLRDYYAWTWGDALFIVIDPYWHSSKPVDNVFNGGKKNRDMWAITLGNEQYKWLKQTLESSKSKYKFVFTHHVLGTGRGGIENAGLFEWGGNNIKGDREFEQKRPGWELPIHQLMAKNRVTIFFQGHDHIFARQQLDGVVYQTLAETADPNYALYNKAAYRSGDILPNSGRVRVTVASDKVTVEYIRSWLPGDETEQHKNGEIACHYSIPNVSNSNISPTSNMGQRLKNK
ncbi:MAG: metallophosphoesterase [Lentisphaerota bacterium]